MTSNSERFSTRLVLKRPIPRELLADVEDKLRFAAEGLLGFRIDPSRADIVELELAAHADEQTVGDKVRRMVEGMIAGWRTVEPRVRWDGRAVVPPYSKDVWDELEAAGMVQTLAPGQVALSGQLVALLEYFDQQFLLLAHALNAQEVRYPQMIAVEALEKCQYFSSFPHHVTFCSHLKEDLDVISAFAKARDHGAGYPFEQGLRPPAYVQNPAVCFHAYHAAAGTHLTTPRILTTVGRCFRYESTAMTSLERLWDFTMREIIFMGPGPWVKEMREETIRALISFVSGLGLQAWIESASDAFFMTNFVARKFHQLLTDAKFELRLSLPFSGKSLAVASFNYHEDFFGRSYQASFDDKPMHTGCTAFGLERWVYAFLCQHGLDPRGWPEPVQLAVLG